jgi:hypothetical protein
MKKRLPFVRGLAVAALVTTGLCAAPAEARLLDLRAGGRLGGVAGWGSSATPDFFDSKSGAGGGFQLGAKLLVLDLSLNFTQLFNGGTVSEALLGFTFDIPVGNLVFQDGLQKGKSRNVIRPVLNAGFATNTPSPVSLPLDDAQLFQKGFTSNFGGVYEYFLNEFIGVGAQLDYGWHYFVAGGKATSTAHSAGYHFDGFANLMFHLGI